MDKAVARWVVDTAHLGYKEEEVTYLQGEVLFRPFLFFSHVNYDSNVLENLIWYIVALRRCDALGEKSKVYRSDHSCCTE